MIPGPVQGFLAPLYYNSATYASPTWVKMENVKDVAVNESAEAIDVSAQFSGEKKAIPGQLDSSISFDYQYFRETSDAVFDALQASRLPGAPIEVAEADGPIAEAGTVYSRNTYFVSKFDKKADLGGSIIYSVELKPTIAADGTVRNRQFVEVS